GKRLGVRRRAGFLPPPTPDEAIEVSTIWSGAGLLPCRGGLVHTRPFRAPHHTISVPGLIGGGAPPHPGEVTLAHRGVLFLDELPEFQQHVLESLRQPLEDGRVSITRASGLADFPARFQLVPAANPCRRGCPSLDRCLCTPAERGRYLGRLSRPLLDRIDLHVELPALVHDELAGDSVPETSSAVRTRVIAARDRQRARARDTRARVNADLSPRQVRRICPLLPDAERLLAAAMSRLGLSARGHDRVLRVARTIADLEGEDRIAAAHVAEAIQYRGLDRTWRGGRRVRRRHSGLVERGPLSFRAARARVQPDALRRRPRRPPPPRAAPADPGGCESRSGCIRPRRAPGCGLGAHVGSP